MNTRILKPSSVIPEKHELHFATLPPINDAGTASPYTLSFESVHKKPTRRTQDISAFTRACARARVHRHHAPIATVSASLLHAFQWCSFAHKLLFKVTHLTLS